MKAEQNEDVPVPERVKALLGPVVLQIVLEAQGGDCSTLVRARGECAGGFPAGLLAKAAAQALNPAQLADLRTILLDETTYNFDATARVPFLPGHGLRLRGKKDEAIVLLDLVRGKIAFLFGGNEVHRDFARRSAGMERLRNIVAGLFSQAGGAS